MDEHNNKRLTTLPEGEEISDDYTRFEHITFSTDPQAQSLIDDNDKDDDEDGTCYCYR